jgi:hypothetical protein
MPGRDDYTFGMIGFYVTFSGNGEFRPVAVTRMIRDARGVCWDHSCLNHPLSVHLYGNSSKAYYSRAIRGE